MKEKPPYNVPSMAAIAAIPWNGYSVVSTFSGCGGSCLGYRMAGFRVLWANEFVPAAQASYKANSAPGSILDGRDIRQVKPEQILAAVGLKAGELDLLDGSPPCQAFSTAGKREKGWGKKKRYEHGASQCNEDLFFEYVRILDGLQPKVFVAENVSGLVKGTAKGYFLEILARLKKCGYRVKARVLDAQWLGVPQMRQRLIFVGVRNDLAAEPAYPKPMAYRYSVRDAIPWISDCKSGPTGFGVGSLVPDGPAPTVSASMQAPYSGHEVTIRHERGGPHFVERVMHSGEPAPTITSEVLPIFVEIQSGARPKRYSSSKPSSAVMAGRTTEMKSAVERRKFTINPHTSSKVIHDESGLQSRGDVTDKPAPCVKAQRASLFVEAETDISRFAIGREWDKIKSGGKSGKYLNLVKAHTEKPSPCVSALGGNISIASVVHPIERRKFTIAELKRICAFPDDFILTGTYAQQWERLGNSVPPLMMRAVAEVIRDQILNPLKNNA